MGLFPGKQELGITLHSNELWVILCETLTCEPLMLNIYSDHCYREVSCNNCKINALDLFVAVASR